MGLIASLDIFALVQSQIFLDLLPGQAPWAMSEDVQSFVLSDRNPAILRGPSSYFIQSSILPACACLNQISVSNR